MKKQIAIACDHAGVELKNFIKSQMPEIEWVDEGTNSQERTDYPDFAAKLAQKVSQGEIEQGILICGSGIGMCIAANKFPRVRAAVVESEQTAKLSKAHNDVNVLCLGARILKPDQAKSILNAWLKTPFEAGRHAQRLEKLNKLENQKNAPKK